MGETGSAFPRRMREGFFLKYIQNNVLDIGCGDNPVSDECERWDIIYGNGDATFMEGVPDNHFDTVYASHLLEHLNEPVVALRNWWRILKVGGWLVVVVPHRDLYEKKKLLPSRWNGDHKTFWLPVHGEPPHTRGLLDTFEEAIGPNYWFEYLRVCHDGCTNVSDPLAHAVGEYSIEFSAKKA